MTSADFDHWATAGLIWVSWGAGWIQDTGYKSCLPIVAMKPTIRSRSGVSASLASITLRPPRPVSYMPVVQIFTADQSSRLPLSAAVACRLQYFYCTAARWCVRYTVVIGVRIKFRSFVTRCNRAMPRSLRVKLCARRQMEISSCLLLYFMSA